MNRKEYKNFEYSIEQFFKTEGITNLSSIEDCESYFSHLPCDCCQRHWGGEREDANGYNPTTKKIYEYSVCIDCIYYAAYGHLDDMSMLDIEKG